MVQDVIFESEKAKAAMVKIGKALKSMEPGPEQKDAIAGYVQLFKSLGFAETDDPIFLEIIDRIGRSENIN